MQLEISGHKYEFNRRQDQIEILENMIKDSDSIQNSLNKLKQHFSDTFIVI